MSQGNEYYDIHTTRSLEYGTYDSDTCEPDTYKSVGVTSMMTHMTLSLEYDLYELEIGVPWHIWIRPICISEGNEYHDTYNSVTLVWHIWMSHDNGYGDTYGSVTWVWHIWMSHGNDYPPPHDTYQLFTRVWWHIWTSHGNSMLTHMDQSLEYDIYQTVIVTTTLTHISYLLEYRDAYESVRVTRITTHTWMSHSSTVTHMNEWGQHVWWHTIERVTLGVSHMIELL